MIDSGSPGLPHEFADRITRPFTRFLRIEAAAGASLLVATIVALILANTTWSEQFLAFWEMPIGMQLGALDFTRSTGHWINDALMTFFFFLVSLEMKREFALGELRDLRTAALPLSAALGGMIVPALIYVTILAGDVGTQGWGTVMATDTAFVIGGLALFGSRLPESLRLFLIALAIFDDIGAILVVAISYGNALNFVAVSFALIAMCLIAIAARLGVRSIPIYFLFGGAVWLCLDLSGIHATIAGVILGLMTPTRIWVGGPRLRAILGNILNPRDHEWSGDTSDRRELVEAGRAISESLSPLERLEMMLHPWVGFVIMPLFALANAGVAFSASDFQTVSIAIFFALVFGKPIGVLLFSWLAVRLGLATLGAGLNWPTLIAGAFLTGIGFTMSFFIANLAYPSTVLAAAKLGILLASLTSAIMGLVAIHWVTRHNRGKV
ncbi:Na+/H+ antiporter NhaA [Sphingobium sp. LF-16]|jgi:NhaA family Na+:H+ antiporter|uniref:Na+/H+ antiporter NhaA n=1 Tax=Sphingobium TaxID=165695 RepID=UPI000F07927A|nr:Na+/H+ antiporter NhaA [Sphingobium sp. LF-16]